MTRPPRHALTLLDHLAGEPGAWQHGYALMKATGLASGTLYPLLMRLADEGLVDSRWQDSDTRGRPPRHAYRITVAGLRRLAAARAGRTGGAAPAGSAA